VKKRANREAGLFGTNPKCERCSKECKQWFNVTPVVCGFKSKNVVLFGKQEKE